MAAVPDAALVDVVLNSNSRTAAALAPDSGAEALVLGIMGGGYAVDGSGGPYTFTSTAEFSFDPTQLTESDLLVALLNPAAGGTGFDSLQLRIYKEDAVVFDETFTDLVTTLAVFDDHLINLGDWRDGLSGDLDLKFELDLVASNPGDSFYFNVLAGSPTLVPLPAAGWLFASAFLTLPAIRRRCRGS